MDRHERVGPKVIGGLDGLLGIHVQVRPARAILDAIERHPVKRPVALADVGKALPIAGVATEEQPPLR